MRRVTVLPAILRSAVNIVKKCTVKVAAPRPCIYVMVRDATEPIVVDRGLNIALMEIGIVQSMSGYMKRVTGIHFALIASLELCNHYDERQHTQGKLHECMLC